jgi:hypothetical protein
MYQEPQLGPGVFSKLLAIWGIVLVIIIGTALVTGGQVYWWQKAVARQEQQNLKQQIRDLKNEIQVLKSNRPLNQGIQKVKLPAAVPKAVPEEIKLQKELEGREKKVIVLLSRGDMESLARYVHPENGLRFSMSSEVNTRKDQVFSKKELIRFFRAYPSYTWGYAEENGMPLRLKTSDYYWKYVYDAPYADTGEISYQDAMNAGFGAGNCFEAYPHSIVVEYRVSETGTTDKVGANWRSIRLVFEKHQKTWFLTGIIHELWTL